MGAIKWSYDLGLHHAICICYYASNKIEGNVGFHLVIKYHDYGPGNNMDH